MTDGDDYLEDDEEETLVYVEIEGVTANGTFSDEKLQLDMFGLDSEHPIMQVNGRYYEGTYEDAVGTYMFFDKENNSIIEDPVFDKAPTLKYQTKTRKVLKMKRVFVKPRLDVLGDSDHPGCVPNRETIIEAGVPPKYQDDALSLWNEMRKERLEAMNEYLEKQKQRKEKRQQGIEPDSESDDDSPFAMYKNESAGNQGIKDSQQATVIDPGPSTSKDYVEPAEINPAPEKEDILIKNQGHVEVFSNKKSRSDGKRRRKKMIEDEETDVQESHISDKVDECLPLEEEITFNEQTDTIDIYQSEGNSSGTTEGVAEKLLTEGGNQTLEVPSVVDKKLEKQLKREAKMQEISERLKKTVNEFKSRSIIDKSAK